jgi:hypothetical protein
MANRHKKQSAGKSGANADAYAGGSSTTAKEAKNTTNAFKKGGKVMGCKSKARMDKYARGGRTGGSPFSSAHVKTSGDA